MFRSDQKVFLQNNFKNRNNFIKSAANPFWVFLSVRICASVKLKKKNRNIFLEKMFETWNIPCLDSISKNIFEICFECLSSTQKNEFRWVVFISIFQCKQIIDDSANLKVNKVKTNEQNFHFHWLLLLKKFAYFLCTLKFMKIEIIRIC